MLDEELLELLLLDAAALRVLLALPSVLLLLAAADLVPVDLLLELLEVELELDSAAFLVDLSFTSSLIMDTSVKKPK
ncbi:hypothetical protein HH1059_15450 [Halorhodospira halochloris]|uniref:Uncharacterized protein n=1 Tax=Halorhodospira halochloris TaxID=1052 RepID=A0A0X8XA14_HALHR|nr:hypothetical protein [Halorhodospira halochloris]BAU58252.1 hypothetical protein HH1059_15450 [Halorhodospira halochloris]